MAQDIIIPIALFGSIFGILYVYFTTRNKERLALIEKGADASLFNTGKRLFNTGKQFNKNTTLKIGMFLVGIALGLLLGNVIAETTRLKEEVAYFSMTFLCGGLSLITFYFIEKKMIKANE
jgi:ABC-type Fe3+-siderophore transport system permease subunit